MKAEGRPLAWWIKYRGGRPAIVRTGGGLSGNRCCLVIRETEKRYLITPVGRGFFLRTGRFLKMGADALVAKHRTGWA